MKFTEPANGGVYDLSQDSFQFAIGIEHWYKGVRNDGKYLKWVINHVKHTGGEGLASEEVLYPMH